MLNTQSSLFRLVLKFCFTIVTIYQFYYTRWRKNRPEHLHALFTRAVKVNQCKSIYVMTKHLRICVGIFASNTSVLAVIQTKQCHTIKQFLQAVCYYCQTLFPLLYSFSDSRLMSTSCHFSLIHNCIFKSSYVIKRHSVVSLGRSLKFISK